MSPVQQAEMAALLAKKAQAAQQVVSPTADQVVSATIPSLKEALISNAPAITARLDSALLKVVESIFEVLKGLYERVGDHVFKDFGK